MDEDTTLGGVLSVDDTAEEALDAEEFDEDDADIDEDVEDV